MKPMNVNYCQKKKLIEQLSYDFNTNKQNQFEIEFDKDDRKCNMNECSQIEKTNDYCNKKAEIRNLSETNQEPKSSQNKIYKRQISQQNVKNTCVLYDCQCNNKNNKKQLKLFELSNINVKSVNTQNENQLCEDNTQVMTKQDCFQNFTIKISIEKCQSQNELNNTIQIKSDNYSKLQKNKKIRKFLNEISKKKYLINSQREFLVTKIAKHIQSSNGYSSNHFNTNIILYNGKKTKLKVAGQHRLLLFQSHLRIQKKHFMVKKYNLLKNEQLYFFQTIKQLIKNLKKYIRLFQIFMTLKQFINSHFNIYFKKYFVQFLYDLKNILNNVHFLTTSQTFLKM